MSRRPSALDLDVAPTRAPAPERGSAVAVATDESGRVHTVPEWWVPVLLLANFGLLVTLVALTASIDKCRT
jgi:hypothetical protein